MYNAALSEYKDAYKQHIRTRMYQNEQGHWIIAEMQANLKVQSVTYLQQQNALPDIKNEIREEYQEIAAHVLQDVLRRLDKGMKAFYRRIREGQTPGFPRFKGRNRYDSFTYPDGAGWKLEGNRLHLSKMGTIKVKLHRPIEGKIKTVTIKREGEQWYAVFFCEVEQQTHLPYTDDTIGIDLGLSHFATLSTGDIIDNPRYYRCGEAKLRKAQEHLSRCKRGSHRREKAKKLVAKAHRKVRNQRNDFLHKQSRQLVNTYDTIVFEDLAPSNLSRAPKPKQDESGNYVPNGASAKAGLNKSIRDAGWGMFQQFCTYKAANAGRDVLFVNPHYTSQVCSGCGSVRKKELRERWHSCECGTELDRDHNAALNILARGQQWINNSQGGTRPTLATA